MACEPPTEDAQPGLASRWSICTPHIDTILLHTGHLIHTASIPRSVPSCPVSWGQPSDPILSLCPVDSWFSFPALSNITPLPSVPILTSLFKGLLCLPTARISQPRLQKHSSQQLFLPRTSGCQALQDPPTELSVFSIENTVSIWDNSATDSEPLHQPWWSISSDVSLDP